MTLQQTLEQALKPLTDCTTADEVADVLRKAGITGIPSDPYECPIARYLSGTTGVRIAVLRASIFTEGANADPTAAMKDFMFRFFFHAYPDLVEGAAK